MLTSNARVSVAVQLCPAFIRRRPSAGRTDTHSTHDGHANESILEANLLFLSAERRVIAVGLLLGTFAFGGVIAVGRFNNRSVLGLDACSKLCNLPMQLLHCLALVAVVPSFRTFLLTSPFTTGLVARDVSTRFTHVVQALLLLQG